jgi:exonuclease VII small subunit
VVAERELLPEQKAEATRDIAKPPSPAEPPRKTVRAAPRPKAPAGPDRIMLGAPPADVAAGTTAPPPKGSRAELDERMQKLEATIQSLNTQIEALDKALALTAESIALQQKLQAAQKSVAEPGNVPAPVAAPAIPPPAAGSNWLEVITAAFVGGLLAAGLALLLGRRRNDAVALELPLTVTTNPTHRPTMAVTPAVPAPVGPRATADRETLAGPADFEASEMGMDGDESVLALAEIMLSFGRPEAAAQTLSQYIEEHAPENPKPWLMLLDLYRRGRLRSEYARLAPLLKQHFNLYVAPWEDIGNPVPGLKSIEDYAHVTRRVTATWGTQDCLDYLRSLVHDTREGQRGGFPLEVIEEIVLLLHTLEHGYNLQAVRRSPAGAVADAA